VNAAFFTREGEGVAPRVVAGRGAAETGVGISCSSAWTLRARRGRLESGVKAPRPRSSEKVKEEPEAERRCLRSRERAAGVAVIIIVTLSLAEGELGRSGVGGGIAAFKNWEVEVEKPVRNEMSGGSGKQCDKRLEKWVGVCRISAHTSP
jgi:hypothetical protein